MKSFNSSFSFLPPPGWYRGHRLRRKSKKVRSSTHFEPCVSVLFLSFNWHFLLQGIFPACYIHLKEATVEGSGWELFHSFNVFSPTSLFSGSELIKKLELFFFFYLQLKTKKRKHDSPKSFRSTMVFAAPIRAKFFFKYISALWHCVWLRWTENPWVFTDECCVDILRQKETVIPADLPLVQEVTTTLREWATIWRDLYVVSGLTHTSLTHTCCVKVCIFL